MSGANFTPTLNGYVEQSEFKFWCQKVLPLVYDDALSYYEVLSQLCEYVNDLLSDVQMLADKVEELEELIQNA